MAADFVPGEVLIQLKSDANASDLAGIRGLLAPDSAARLAGPLATAGTSGPAARVSLATGLGVADALQRLRQNPAVAYAEPNWVLHNQATSNDPFFADGSLWGMYGDASTPANSFGSHAADAWAAGYTGSPSVLVGVVDEGIDYTHPDLQGNVWTNPFDPVDGVDNDGNGYIDDVHGWDFYNGDNTVYDAGGDDHGTHVAGTIGAKGGNGIGVAGVNWNVGMISAKFLGTTGGTIAGAIEALDYLTDLKVRHGLNLVATNNSWTGGGFSQALQDAIARAAKAGILFVAAAGNASNDNDALADYPSNYDTTSAAGYDGVISVAALNTSGELASFSSYGATTVDLAAPGAAVNSTVPGGSYASYSGTSMAVPHVTGAIALYAASHPGASAQEIKQAILDSARATPTPTLAGKTVTGGRLNIGAMFPGVTSSLVSISDASRSEGAYGTTSQMTFTVTLRGGHQGTVNVNYATADGTARAGSDYQPVSGTLAFPPSATDQTRTLSVPIYGDAALEPDETFFVNLSTARAEAILADGQGRGTIKNDDFPSLSIADVSKLEGNSDNSMPFTVRLSSPSPQTVTVKYATSKSSASNAASSTSDYRSTSGTLTFSPGQTSKTLSVRIYGDRKVERNEVFLVRLSSPVNAKIARAQATGTILNDDGVAAASVLSRPAAAIPSADSRWSAWTADILFAALARKSEAVASPWTPPADWWYAWIAGQE